MGKGDRSKKFSDYKVGILIGTVGVFRESVVEGNLNEVLDWDGIMNGAIGLIKFVNELRRWLLDWNADTGGNWKT